MHVVDMVDAQLLKLACPENSIAVLAGWADPIKLGCVKFGIVTARGVACLLAQAGTESAGLTRLAENLNYSAQRLAEVWPHRFAVDPHAPVKVPNVLALNLAHNPQAIANHVYASRMGNGPPQSGDGWRYRGFGPFQLTGKDNQEAFGEAVGLTVDQVPDYLRTTNGGAMSMCWFFKMHGLEDLAATPGCADETRAVNGGLNGLADRTKRFSAVLAELTRRGAQ
jgi:putative chitinase